MPPNRGMNASNREVHAQHHRCKGSVESTFYKLPKKWGCSLSTPAFDASPPFTEKEAPRGWREGWQRNVAITTKGLLGSRDAQKRRVP